MFRFEHTEYLYLLLGLLPVGILLYLGWRWYLGQQKRLGDANLITSQADQVSPFRYRFISILTLLSLAFGIIAWANPQWGAKREKVKAKSTDIFLALDISNSMYCEDIAPNRIELAKRFTQNLVNHLKGERIGLILFAGNAYLQMPLTNDYAAAQLFVRSASPKLATTQGTALEGAIETAMENFEQGKTYHKAMILISDGEDHNTEAIEKAREASESGLSIFTIGVGSPEGSFIPMTTSNGQVDWKRDTDGQPVRTRLNETLLRELASVANGQYFRLSRETEILDAIKQQVDKMEKQEYEDRSFTEYESYYQIFLALSLLFLLWEWIIRNNLYVNMQRWFL